MSMSRVYGNDSETSSYSEYRFETLVPLIRRCILEGRFLAHLRKWRNWQTRKPQELVPHKGVGVRIPPSAPTFSPESSVSY